MNQNRKETAWKKNRKFSEIHGGRTRLKCADGIFKRHHNILPPAIGQETPIFIVENKYKNSLINKIIQNIGIKSLMVSHEIIKKENYTINTLSIIYI
jgi:hypothetical protein